MLRLTPAELAELNKPSCSPLLSKFDEQGRAAEAARPGEAAEGRGETSRCTRDAFLVPCLDPEGVGERLQRAQVRDPAIALPVWSCLTTVDRKE